MPVRRGVLLALAVLLVTGCGGDDEAQGPAGATGPTSAGRPLERTGPVPEGWKVTATRFFSYAHPADWTVEVRPSKSGAPGEVVSEARGPERTAGLPPDVLVAATPEYKSGLAGLISLNDADAKVRYADRDVIDERRPEVPGSVGARLVEGDVENEAPDGTRTRVRQFDLVALSQEGTAVSLFVQVPAAEADSSRVRDVVETLEIR